MRTSNMRKRLSFVSPGSLALAASFLAACSAGIDDEVSKEPASASVSAPLTIGTRASTFLWIRYLNYLKTNAPLIEELTVAATSAPMASPYSSTLFTDQLHFVYIGNDSTGGGRVLLDEWIGYPSGQWWNRQQLNRNGLTSGPDAADYPAVTSYYRQLHAVYPDSAGTLWDAWYDGATSKWNLQQINRNGVTAGPAAGDRPAAAVYGTQLHIVYPDASGALWDSWIDITTSGKWNLQRINLGGVTAGPAAAGTPVVKAYTPGKNIQMHVVYTDVNGGIWDSWYDSATSRWNLQQINLKGVTAGPAVFGSAAVALYNPCLDGDSCPSAPMPGAQMHIVYHAAGSASPAIWDSWYDPAGPSWHLQNITELGKLYRSTSALLATVHSGELHVITESPEGWGIDAFYDPKYAAWGGWAANWLW